MPPTCPRAKFIPIKLRAKRMTALGHVGGIQGIVLTIKRLAAIGFGDAGIADQHVSQTFVCDAGTSRVHSAIEVVPYPISQTNIDNGLCESKRNMAHRTILTERQRAALRCV